MDLLYSNESGLLFNSAILGAHNFAVKVSQGYGITSYVCHQAQPDSVRDVPIRNADSGDENELTTLCSGWSTRIYIG
jgi:hypothetical protein